MSGAPSCFNNLTIAGGSTVTTTTDICVRNDLTLLANGRLNNAFRATIQRDCSNAGTVDLLATGVVDVTRNLANSGGAWQGNGTLVMSGTGTVTATPGLQHLEVSTAGMVAVNGVFLSRVTSPCAGGP